MRSIPGMGTPEKTTCRMACPANDSGKESGRSKVSRAFKTSSILSIREETTGMETKTTESSQDLSQETAKGAPTGAEDGRWKAVNRTMRLNGYAPHALIETLHAVQESFGYLDIEALKYVSEQLKLPRSLVYGAATFYHFFSLKPAGEHTCVVCMGTACYIAGVPKILDAIQQSYNVSPGETTADNKISVLTARCIGSCGLSPAAVFDGEVAGKLTPDAVLDKLGRWVAS